MSVLPATRTARPWRTALAAQVAALLLALAAGQADAARLGLVIGNDEYKALNRLSNAAKDARDVAAELRSAGFQVPDKWVVQNGTRNSMRAALQDFVARLKPEDEVVFYYSGHGVEIDAQAALVPIDLSDPARNPLDGSLRPLGDVDLAKQQVLDESITLNRVAVDIAGRGVKFSLLIVDACRDNPILELLKKAHASSPLKNAGAPPAAGLIADSVADSQVLLFSASKGQQSLDRLGPGDAEQNGVFTRVLLKAIRTPGLGLRDLLPQVKAEVRALAASVRINGRPHVQEPRSMASYDAPNFHFRSVDDLSALARPTPASVPVPVPVVPAVRVTSADEVEQQWWNLIKDSRDIQDFKDYLLRYPNGRFASLAARQVRVLTSLPPVQVATVVPEPVRPIPEPPRGTERRPGDVFKDCNECPEMVVIPAGSFVMGSPEGEAGRDSYEGPQHTVAVKSFAAGKFEVTFDQWDACVTAIGCSHRPDDLGWGRGSRPVINVNYEDVQQYAKWLSAATGQSYRLLSEAEWEYAARAGTATAYSWGNGIGRGQATCAGCGSQWDNRQTAPVGQFAANAFGLYDMHGNVWEWVQDVWHDNYSGAPTDGSPWTVGGYQPRNMLRGGSWGIGPKYLRSAIRLGSPQVNRDRSIGFRVARTL